MDADPAANIVVTGTASLAQLKSIDALMVQVQFQLLSMTLQPISRYSTNEVPGVYKPYIEQATNFQITITQVKNLSALSNIGVAPTLRYLPIRTLLLLMIKLPT